MLVGAGSATQPSSALIFADLWPVPRARLAVHVRLSPRPGTSATVDNWTPEAGWLHAAEFQSCRPAGGQVGNSQTRLSRIRTSAVSLFGQPIQPPDSCPRSRISCRRPLGTEEPSWPRVINDDGTRTAFFLQCKGYGQVTTDGDTEREFNAQPAA